MIKELFLALKDRYQRLQKREKILLAVFLLIGIIVGFDRLVYSKIVAYKQDLSKQLSQANNELLALKTGIQRNSIGMKLFTGKESEVLNLVLTQIAAYKIEKIKLRQNVEGRNIIIQFKLRGKIKNLLDFIATLESQDFLIVFERVDLFYHKHDVYNFEGEILINRI
jgi:hypothetical protein